MKSSAVNCPNTFDQDCSCDPDSTRLAREFMESNNGDRENEEDVSSEGEQQEEEIPDRCGCTRQCFSLFANKQQLITDYRRNMAEFTKDERIFCCYRN